MLCESGGLGVWSIEVNKAAAGCGVLKAPAFKRMQGHPKLQGVTHMHISERIRATWQKCFHVFWFLRSEIRLWYLKSWTHYKNLHTLSIFHMGPKSSHALHIVWLHVLLSVFFFFFGVSVASDPTVFFRLKSVNFRRFKRAKSLSLIQLAPPPPLHFIKSLLYYTL